MANPQLEDGRTEIANELVDTLAKTYFSPAESKIVWSVFRKTYGWHKKSDHISYSQFKKMSQAIPPAYTGYIGKYLMQEVTKQEVLVDVLSKEI